MIGVGICNVGLLCAGCCFWIGDRCSVVRVRECVVWVVGVVVLVFGVSLLCRRYTWILSALQGGKISEFRDCVVLFNLKFVDSFNDVTETSLNCFLGWLVLGSFLVIIVH